MKGNHWFIAGIIVFLVLMFAIECRLPKKFVWNPTFSHYDKQPFGCAVFDSLLSSSLPKGYSLSRKTFYELEQEDTTLRRGILVVTDNLHLTDVDVEAMLKMAGRGDRIMLVGSSFSRILKDTLGFECSYSYFSPSALKKYATALLSKDSLCWVGDSAVYPLDQPESAALAAFARCVHPDLMLALHTQGSVIYPGPAESAPAGSAALAAAMSEASGYPVEPVPEASANAGFKDWFLQCFRRPAFTIEMGIGENPLPMTQLPALCRALRAIMTAALLW